MISQFNYTENDYSTFKSEFFNRIPDYLIDNHIHLWTKNCLSIPKSDYKIYKNYKPWTDFDYMEEFTFSDYINCTEKIFPQKKYEGIFFGLPFPQMDIVKTNQYVMKVAEKNNVGFFYIPGQDEDIYATNNNLLLLEKKEFVGFKPYPDLVHVNNGEPGIFDMINRSVLEFSNKNRLSILLHIPRKERLRSPENRKELLEIVTDFPDIHFIIAHVGRSFCYPDVVNGIDFLADKENVSFDTALINDPLVLEYLMRKVDSRKILYGSDAPLAFCRGKDVSINNKHYYVTDRIAPWGLSPTNEKLVDFTFFVYEEIRAILYASKTVYVNAEEKQLENIFYLNSKELLYRKYL